MKVRKKPISTTSFYKTRNTLLVASNLSHSFDYKLFNDITLSIKEGESIAIIGVSGSGKSTLLHILATLLKPQEGRVIYNQNYLYTLSSEELLEIRRKDMGIIFQSHYLFKGFTVRENLEISSILSGNEIDMKLLEDLKIDETLDQNIGDLSGGQQQRVSIARVLIKKPKLIFADELTGNLDKKTAQEVMSVMHKYIQEHNAGLFIVTHDEDVASSCENVYRLENKRLAPIIL